MDLEEIVANNLDLVFLVLELIQIKLSCFEHQLDRVGVLLDEPANGALEIGNLVDPFLEHGLVALLYDSPEGVCNDREQQVEHDNQVEDGCKEEHEPTEGVVIANVVKAELSIRQEIGTFNLGDVWQYVFMKNTLFCLKNADQFVILYEFEGRGDFFYLCIFKTVAFFSDENRLVE